MSAARPRRAEGRDGHAPPAAGDGAPPPPLRRGRRRRQRRDDRDRGDRGGVDPQVSGRSFPSGPRSRSPARRTARRSRSPTTSPTASPPSRPRRSGRGPPRAGRSTASCPRPGPPAPPPGGVPSRDAGRGQARDAAPGGGRGPRLRRRERRPLRDASGPSAARAPATAWLADRRRGRPADGPGQPRGRCSGRASTSSTGDPAKALDLLTEAYAALDTAASNGSRRRRSTRSASRRAAGLDRLYGVVPVAAATVISFADAKTPFDIGAMILGPGGVAVRARPGDEVGLSDRPPDEERRRRSSAEGTNAAGGVEGGPEAPGARRDRRPRSSSTTQNVLWRWRPADDEGRRDDDEGPGLERGGWGDDIRRSGRSSATPAPGLYNLYVVDPSEQQILVYYPGQRRQRASRRPRVDRLAVARDVSKVDATVHRRRHLRRRRRRRSSGSSTAGPRAGIGRAELPDTLLRDAPHYSLLASASDKRTGSIYACDKPNARVVAIDKAKGTYLAQYRLAGNARAGRTCAGCTSSWPARTRRRRWSGPTRTASSRRSWRPSPTPPPPALRRPGRPGRPRPASGAARRLAAGLRPAVIPLRDANPVRRTPIITIAIDRRLRRGLRLHPGRRGQPGHRGRRQAVRDVGRRPGQARRGAGRRATT